MFDQTLIDQKDEAYGSPLVKVVHGLTDNEILKHEWIEYTKNYSLCLQADLYDPLINGTYKEMNSLRCYGAVIWNSLSSNIKSLLEFK